MAEASAFLEFGRKLLSIFFTILLGGTCSSAQNVTIDVSKLPPHPRLLLDSAGIARLKNRLASSAWAQASWAELTAAVDASLTHAMALPPRGGNWSHHYVCPTHGSRLNRGKSIGRWEWEHLCPVGDHILKGDPAKAPLDFDGNAISGIHSDYARQAVNQGLVFQVTGDKRYAKRAREILLAYAERYLTYPLHDNQGNAGQGGRVASQSLSEASWLIEMLQGADLVWTTFTTKERTLITDKLLRPALEQVILPRRLGIHNIQCRHNSAIGLAGLLLGDNQLISTALDDPATGFHQQLAKGVLQDGLWLEGSSGYHFFTIAGLWPLAEAARNCGLDLYGPKFHSMFRGPLSLAMPNYVLPNFNDSGLTSLKNLADEYELALARFNDADFVPLIASSERRGRLALLYGLVDLPSAVTSPRTASRNLPVSGYAILRSDAGENATWLCVKYGPHGGGHGHPDKNSFILYSQGQILATDAGTHAYGSSLHRDWDKTSFAHNTLIVDQKSQAAATGESLAFGTEKAVSFSMTDAGPIYQGVRFIRTVALLNPQLILFIDQVQADQAHCLDLAYHQSGNWVTNDVSSTNNPPGKPWSVPDALGYTHLRAAESRMLAQGDPLFLPTKVTESLKPAIIIAATEPTEIITGYGLLKTTEDRVPLMLQRQQGKGALFVWAISLEGLPVHLTTSCLSDASGRSLSPQEAVLVEADAGSSHWTIVANPGLQSLIAHPSKGPSFRVKTAVTIR